MFLFWYSLLTLEHIVIRRFNPSATDLVHVLVACVLPHISGCNLIVDGRQVVSLISVHGRGSLSDAYGLIHSSLVQVGFTVQY